MLSTSCHSLLWLAAATAFEVSLEVGKSTIAQTSIQSLTSVTMDVCLAKQGFPFDDPVLKTLTRHLGGGASILRIGGSDQNNFYYDMESTKLAPFSRSTGKQCCTEHTSCHGCAKDCTMPAGYWKAMVDFAQSTGHRFVYGLVPEEGNATALVRFSAQQKLPVHAYTFGNEVDSPAVTAGYPALRKLFDDTSVFPEGSAPLLAGPDVALQRHDTIEKALAGQDATVNDKLAWVRNFTAAIGSTLDVVSWHTYDFHADSDINVAYHAPLTVNAETHRLWDTRYLDMALWLNDNMTTIAQDTAPQAAVWLSESNSVCHQGVSGATNAYLNSVWLVNRVGRLAANNVSVMARQSLVGYNYSLLGNWPVEPIAPNPDFFTTVLFRRLFGDRVLPAVLTSITAKLVTDTHGDRVRAFAFCASETQPSGSVAIALINFDDKEGAVFQLPTGLGDGYEYLLSPGEDPVVESFAWSSRQILLNGQHLVMGAEGALPAAVTGPGRRSPFGKVKLPALTTGFVVFPKATLAVCQ